MKQVPLHAPLLSPTSLPFIPLLVLVVDIVRQTCNSHHGICTYQDFHVGSLAIWCTRDVYIIVPSFSLMSPFLQYTNDADCHGR